MPAHGVALLLKQSRQFHFDQHPGCAAPKRWLKYTASEGAVPESVAHCVLSCYMCPGLFQNIGLKYNNTGNFFCYTFRHCNFIFLRYAST